MSLRTPVLASIGIATVLLLGVLVAVGATDGVDRALMDAVRSGGTSGPLSILDPITELGSTGAVTLIALLCLAIGALVGPWQHGIVAAAVIGLTALGVEIVKSVVARERPEILEPILVEHGFSFPSGHATLSMTAYGVLAVLVWRSRLAREAKLAATALVGMIVFAVGVSRIWLGVHWPSDVLGGWIVGGVIVLLFADLTREVSTEPAAVAVDADRAVPRSDRPAAG
jgi:undecaprenyl-diphosphatase